MPLNSSTIWWNNIAKFTYYSHLISFKVSENYCYTLLFDMNWTKILHVLQKINSDKTQSTILRSKVSTIIYKQRSNCVINSEKECSVFILFFICKDFFSNSLQKFLLLLHTWEKSVLESQKISMSGFWRFTLFGMSWTRFGKCMWVNLLLC